MITQEALMILENELNGAKHFDRQYDDRFGVEGAKIGNILNLRKPPRFLTSLGQALQLEDATETSVPLVLTQQRQCAIAFTSQELGLQVDDFTKRFIRPQVATMANMVDFDALGQYVNVYNEIGIPGTVPSTRLIYLQANQRLNEEAAPFKDRVNVMTPAQNTYLVDAQAGLFQASDKIREQYNSGRQGLGLGVDSMIDQNCRNQVVGKQGGTPVVNGSGQTGNSLITNGWTANAAILNAGDIISIGTLTSGVLAVNPQNRQSTGALRQFVVTSNVTADGSGNATIPISGPSGFGIVTAGPFQTVTQSPTTNMAINVQGAASTSSLRGLMFVSDEAFAMGCADLPLYGGVDIGERVASKEIGMSIRMLRAYDIFEDRAPCRLDILYGFVTKYPELAVRIAN
jgi:P22 coat protein - gene protein 5